MDWTTIAVRLLVAGGLATLIGVEREFRSKPAGLRTNIVVGVATAAFSLAGSEIFPGGDPTRVASEIVSGIGFLGGGAIFASGGRPRGITTAAAMWGSAAIGMTAGQGEFDFAVLVALITVVVLWPLDFGVETYLQRKARQQLDLKLVATDIDGIATAQDELASRGLRIDDVQLQGLGEHVMSTFSVYGRPSDVEGLLTELRSRPSTRFVGYDRSAE